MIPICLPKIGVNLWVHLQFFRTSQFSEFSLILIVTAVSDIFAA
ncbi:MAG: hypothetical protein P8X79_17605 [Reinekea sp.]